MIDSSLFTDNASNMNPTCEIVEKASNRFIRYWANPTTVPTTRDSNDVVNKRFFHISRSAPEKSAHSKKIKIDILGITVNHVVTIVGTPS